MNQRDLVLLNLKRNDLDYLIRAREALNCADECLKKKDITFAKQLINEFVFCDNIKSRISSTDELKLIVILLSEFYTRDDPSRLALFFHIFEIGKNSRKFVLLKFIIVAIYIESKTV